MDGMPSTGSAPLELKNHYPVKVAREITSDPQTNDKTGKMPPNSTESFSAATNVQKNDSSETVPAKQTEPPATNLKNPYKRSGTEKQSFDPLQFKPTSSAGLPQSSLQSNKPNAGRTFPITSVVSQISNNMKFRKSSKRNSLTKQKGAVHLKVFASYPVVQQNQNENYFFKVAMFVQAFNPNNKDNTVIEWKPDVIIRAFKLAYSLGCGDKKYALGSSNEYTDMITECLSNIHYLRRAPGQDNDESVKTGKNLNYSFEIMGGILDIEVKQKNQVYEEIDNLIEEFQMIVASPNFKYVVDSAAYWKYVVSGGSDNGNYENIEECYNQLQQAILKEGSFKSAMTRANSNSQLFHLIHQDNNGNIEKTLGQAKMIVQKQIALDRTLLNRDIPAYVKSLFGLYSANCNQFIFTNHATEQQNTSFLTNSMD